MCFHTADWKTVAYLTFSPWGPVNGAQKRWENCIMWIDFILLSLQYLGLQYEPCEILTENVILRFNPMCNHLRKMEASVENIFCSNWYFLLGMACDHWTWGWTAGALSARTHSNTHIEHMLMVKACLCSLSKETSSPISSNESFWLSAKVTFQGGIWIWITQSPLSNKLSTTPKYAFLLSFSTFPMTLVLSLNPLWSLCVWHCYTAGIYSWWIRFFS